VERLGIIGATQCPEQLSFPPTDIGSNRGCPIAWQASKRVFEPAALVTDGAQQLATGHEHQLELGARL